MGLAGFITGLAQIDESLFPYLPMPGVVGQDLDLIIEMGGRPFLEGDQDLRVESRRRSRTGSS